MSRGRLLVPLLHWRRGVDRSLYVNIRIPGAGFEKEREAFSDYLDMLLEQVKATYLRCWESLHR